MKFAVGLIVAFVVIGIVYFFFFNKPAEAPVPSDSDTVMEDSTMENETADESMMDTTYTLDDIAEHNSAEDCWMAIEGKVYDVTEYIDGGKHPGGAALLQGCGIDATELFNNRPNGSGSHSEQARSFLPNFEIGTLTQ